MSELQPRITGTEMEWAVSVPNEMEPPRSIQLPPAILGHHIRAYAEKNPHVNGGTNLFLGNGARYYIDVQSHPEYATPEDDSFMGTTANEIAGERILAETMQTSYQGEYGITRFTKNAAINKRVLASETSEPWGHHENYAVRTNTGVNIDPASLALLGVHMVTRNIFFGAGFLQSDGAYCLAQKALKVTREFDIGTTGECKPVINLRNQPMADKDTWLRVHVTSGDAVMSPWAMRMQLGTTSLVLRLIEHGETLPGLRFNEPLHVLAQEISKDVELKNEYELMNGKTVSALDAQKILVRAVGRLGVSLPPEEQWTLQEWDRACSDIGRDPRLLRDRSDWVLKQYSLEQLQARRGYAWNSEKMRYGERFWDRVDTEGTGLAMRKGIFSKWMPSEDLITERMRTPPTTTRAHVRGKFIRAFTGSSTATADWHYVKLNSTSFSTPHPHVSSHERVEDLIRRHVPRPVLRLSAWEGI